ncbi:uncharacterized protein BP5553_01021 [Venustampulla echinocandica]|uniref:MAGE domain-containing protein n=1 Tax=Venustampulla echinocandica TaxID=2656787 RepID=A0A370TZT7_9HELO|nr:uncharacterized protein BP5553_01021 [Venustampulla echinocandica]RDL41042.1 hypothetical protein BP5553_01021 [Venustampulla echinocandica]
MPPTSRRSRLVQPEESEEEATQVTQRGPGRRAISENDSDAEDEEVGYDEMDLDGETDSQDQVVKKLVRYALACEFQRVPIKRVGISEKGQCSTTSCDLHADYGSSGKTTRQLQTGVRCSATAFAIKIWHGDDGTTRTRETAAKAKGNSKPTASYILVTTLPAAYRSAEIIAPSLIGSEDDEATYIGLCTVIVSYIGMSPGGQVPDHKLMRILRRLNVEENTPLEKTTVILQRMIRQGYIWRVTDRSGDEETVDWRVGPRGKVEIGNSGISGFVKEIYGQDAPQDLDKRLQRSLGVEVGRGNEEDEDVEGTNGGPSTARSIGRMRKAADDDD